MFEFVYSKLSIFFNYETHTHTLKISTTVKNIYKFIYYLIKQNKKRPIYLRLSQLVRYFIVLWSCQKKKTQTK